MRIIGFSKMWPKLNKQWYERDLHTFTTFRYPRRDRDWEVEEVVQVVYKPRSKERIPLGIARIIRIEPKNMSRNHWRYVSNTEARADPECIIPSEAEEDGFTGQHGGGDVEAMRQFIRDYNRDNPDLLNKITLYWISKPIQEG